MRIVHLIEAITKYAGWVGAMLILPLIAALVIEVMSRYALGKPTLWAFEVSYMAMGAIFMLGMANALRIKQHVSVDFLTLQLSRKTNALIFIIGYILFLPIISWLFYELYQYTLQGFYSQERSGRSAWNPIIWPVFAVWCVGFGLLALQIVAEMLKSFLVLTDKGLGMREEEE